MCPLFPEFDIAAEYQRQRVIFIFVDNFVELLRKFENGGASFPEFFTEKIESFLNESERKGMVIFMYERMLNKKVIPTIEEMTEFCGENAERFSLLNEWLTAVFGTEQKVVFPYGHKYGWGVAHRKKNKLICNIFAEDNAFTVMMRLSDKQYKAIYEQLQKYTQEYIDNKYPCGDGGWIHYRVLCMENFEDVQKLLSVKL